MIKKIKKIWDIIAYPVGQDEDFDRECEDSFHVFLDRMIGVIYVGFSIFAAISLYFLVTREILQ